MYFNRFAQGLEPLDLTGTDEFSSLVASARDLGTSVPATVRCLSRNIVLRGLRFQYLEWGDTAAPSILLLHGGNQTSHSWDLVSLALSDRYHVIALDQRGHGDTEWPRDGVATRQDMAGDALALIEALNLEKPVIGGHSMGGLVTLTLLSEHPDVASKAVIVDVGPELSAEGARVIGSFVRGVEEVGTLEDFIDRVARYDTYRSREHIARTVIYNLMRRVDGNLVSKHDHRTFALFNVAGDPLRRLDLPTLADVTRITCPVLVLHGAESNVFLSEMAERFVKTLPNGELVHVPASGHNIHSQNTPYFINTVTRFLDSKTVEPTSKSGALNRASRRTIASVDSPTRLNAKS